MFVTLENFQDVFFMRGAVHEVVMPCAIPCPASARTMRAAIVAALRGNGLDQGLVCAHLGRAACPGSSNPSRWTW